MLRRFVSWFEASALIAVAVFVAMLFLNDPTPPPGTPTALVEAAGGIDGGAVYEQSCAGCHGGDGSGGIGPRLAGTMVVKFPDPAAQIAVVADGRRGMPAFKTRLSAEEIAAIVEFTRTVLGG
jgi:cytochrome c oxidase subunit II